MFQKTNIFLPPDTCTYVSVSRGGGGGGGGGGKKC